jgi:membrane-bound lytic murein transglycosylase A
MLVPKSLDPVARGRKMPLPDARPSAQIAKLFPQAGPLQVGPLQVGPLTEKPKDQNNGVKPSAPPTVAQAPSAQALPNAAPLPEARPDLKPSREWRHRRYRRYRRSR